MELEHRLAELEQQMALQDTKEQARNEEWEEQLRMAQRGEESARKELQSLRSVLRHSWKPKIIIQSICFIFWGGLSELD